ncbi:MAG: hypothetical protein M5U01_02275 [Ardenticatenaceae bacterium]|nr:hypothetical protein [Ardenticatenaceae bacterium]
MATITVELPAALAQEAEARGISTAELEGVAIRLLEAYLHKRGVSSPLSESWTDGAEFTRRVIAANRELFEELAVL